ncbi:MAG: tetratricopeptide repeat protein, partial [Myxococcales bacterium]|nr:tetratricopeptide repeat protein [Myxococcales bacterium]
MTVSRGPVLRRYLFSLAILAVALPATAFGQDEESTEEEGVYRDCSPEALAALDEMDARLGASPVSSRVLSSGLTAEEADEIREQLIQVRQGQIDQYHEMLRDMPPGYERRADILFRLAEAYWEVAEADQLAARAEYNACVDDYIRCLRDEPCSDPIPDYSQALDSYREVLRDHPDYARIDEVIYRLGDGLIQADESADGVQFLTRLINNYPDSIYIPDAHFLMGEYYFNNDLMIIARQNYDGVLEYPQSDYYNFAIYKTAWVDMNEDQWPDAVRRFQQVVENIDALEATGVPVRFDLRDQAVNDMLVSWTEIPDGWMQARTYLTAYRDEDFMRRKLLAMSDLYNDKGKDDERVAMMEWFVTTYPNDPQYPTWAEYLTESLNNLGAWDPYEDRVRQLVRHMDPNGSWAIANQGNDRALTTARQYSETAFLSIILRNYEEAGRLSRQDLYQEVVQDYDEYFSRWPDSDNAYEQRFNYAEVLYYNVEDHPAAGEQYLEVVRMDTEGEFAHDAIIGALQAFDALMKTEVPDIDEETQLVAADELEALRDLPEEELGPWSQRYVEVVEYFAELFPDDERIPVASWRAAEIYRRANRIGDAARRFETIIQHHPNHRFAEEAAISAFICYQYVEEWERIEYWARFLLENNPNPEDTDLNPERLRSAIAYAINEQAQDLMEAGDEFAAAEMMIALYNEFPDSSFAPDALYNAAAIYERARRVDTAISTYELYLDAFPEDDGVADARFTLGLILDSQADFAGAATWFETVDDDAYAEYEDRATAVISAARLREALSEWDDAVRLYDRYMELEPESELNPRLVFLLAEIEQDRGNLDAAYDRYQQFRDDFSSYAGMSVAATVLQGRIREEQGQTDRAVDLFESAYDQFGEGELAIDEETRQPGGWITAPGWKINDEEERLNALPYAAEARFNVADEAFEECQAISLEYPPGRWRVLAENLESRGEKLEETQNMMFEVVEMGDAAWSVAATARIGELYGAFYTDMYNLPQPDIDECLDDGYSFDACDQLDQQYNTMFYEIMYPIEAKALESFNAAVRIAHDYGIYNEWTTHAVERLREADTSIRVQGEEGVQPNNSTDSYAGTVFITDLTEKLERMRIIEEQRAAEQAVGAGQGV